MSDSIGLIGLVCLDIVNVVPSYPEEDADIEALESYRVRGGNAANSIAVLADLVRLDPEGIVSSERKPALEFLGTLADDDSAQFLRRDLEGRGVSTRLAPTLPGTATPTSYITRSQQNGSRTIVLYRNLPELDWDHVHDVKWGEFTWLHLEGRQPFLRTARMLRELAPKHSFRISIELEKPGPWTDEFIPLGDVLLGSRALARALGFHEAEAFLQHLRTRAKPGAILICPWGEHGAYGMDADGKVHYSPAFKPEKVVDTLGAGDTFNGAAIYGLSQGLSLDRAISFACKVAGTKCGVKGFDNLVPKLPK